MDLTDIENIKALCRRYQISPRRERGQNFLVDREALDKIVATADLKPEDAVLEVGPGFGVLTAELAKRAKKVMAVESDKKLIPILKETIKNYQNVEIIEGDILKVSHEVIKSLSHGAIESRSHKVIESLSHGEYKIVANLPYNITSVVLRKFLSLPAGQAGQEPRPKEMVVLVQKEVAERIVAGTGDMSLLAISVQFYGRPEIAGLVSKKSFYPMPEVDSAILKIREIGQGFSAKFSPDEEKEFFRLVKIGFSARRKQLQNNLAAGLRYENEKIKDILEQIGLNPRIRAQDLSLDDWLKLSDFLRKKILCYDKKVHPVK